MKDKIAGKAERAFKGGATTYTGTDNQYTTNGRPDEGYQASDRDTGAKPSTKDQVVGKAERAFGKAEQVVDNLKDKVV